MSWRKEQELHADVDAPRRARKFVDQALAPRLAAAARAAVVDDVALVVSELVTNAVQAGSGAVTVAIGVQQGEVKVEVTDSVPGWPTRQPGGQDACHGRGLAILQAVTSDWGVDRVPCGKSVWALMNVPAPFGP
jgi:serine/threonine-protein kinase RsbW